MMTQLKKFYDALNIVVILAPGKCAQFPNFL